jgi:hypothetical protein
VHYLDLSVLALHVERRFIAMSMIVFSSAPAGDWNPALAAVPQSSYYKHISVHRLGVSVLALQCDVQPLSTFLSAHS